MNDAAFNQWVDEERNRVVKYLAGQGIENPNVGSWPAFDVAPKFAIWAVESKKSPGKIGWWAFSGDCPTDYVLEAGKCHPRHALGLLLDNWKRYYPIMKSGEQPDEMKFGDGNNLKELGELLEKRVELLSEWHNDDALWEDR